MIVKNANPQAFVNIVSLQQYVRNSTIGNNLLLVKTIIYKIKRLFILNDMLSKKHIPSLILFEKN